MEYYIDLLDSISPLAFVDTYGYQIWIVVRDILAWIVSIGSWIVFGSAIVLMTRYLRLMKQDEAGMTVEGSQGNVYFSALAYRTGFHTNYQGVKRNHPEISKEEAIAKTTFRRCVSIVLVTLALGTFMAFIGAEWGMVALLLFTFRFLTGDTDIRDYYYVYMDYIDPNYEDHE